MLDRAAADRIADGRAAADRATRSPARAAIGPGRLIAVAYGFFTLAAGARSGVQITTHFSRAPLAYLLSAVAALVYLSGTVLMVRAERAPAAGAAARRLCLVEIAGVLGVGGFSVLAPNRFADPTVWSEFGSGYGYVPAALPILALWWLHGGQRPSPPIV